MAYFKSMATIAAATAAAAIYEAKDPKVHHFHHDTTSSSTSSSNNSLEHQEEQHQNPHREAPGAHPRHEFCKFGAPAHHSSDPRLHFFDTVIPGARY